MVLRRPAAPVPVLLVQLTVRVPVTSSIAIQPCLDSSQEVCPWHLKFARAVREPAFSAQAVIPGKDARSLAEEILAMSDETYRAAFRGSAMKRAKLSGLQRNARVVVRNVAED